MRAMTVLGPVDAAHLGVVSPHEHLLIDLTYRWAAPPDDSGLRQIAESPLTMDRLGVARRNMGLIRDNLVLDDEAMAADGLRDFKAAGGGTVVDCSQDGIGRDVESLRRISEASGVHVIAPCGTYLAASHPAYVRESSVGELAARFVRELTVGVGDTGIRAGWIGELGVGQPMYGSFLDAPRIGEDAMAPDEEKVLEAAGRAQAETGAPISVHIWNWRPNRLGQMSLDAIERGGGDPTRTVICHLDINPDLDTALRVVERGAYAELDTFGLELYNDTQATRYPRDEERIGLAASLVERGHLERVLIAQDVCTKTQTTQYGGWGFSHISRHVEPWMRRAGFSAEQLRMLRVENPARLLAYLS
jgi:phosphotriesterase-related protein